jgi:xanthine dehydrogenase accessory factor
LSQPMRPLSDLTVLIRGAGEMASGVAWTLTQCHFKVVLLEAPQPLAVRRLVSFCEAVYEGRKVVEGVQAILVSSPKEIEAAWQVGHIPLLIDPFMEVGSVLKPAILVDAIMAKKQSQPLLDKAPLVVALGPGFMVGRDAHVVIETNRGHNLGRILNRGEAEPDTGRPGNIGGFSEERVLRAPAPGQITKLKEIGDRVEKEETVATVAGRAIRSQITGVLRGLIRDGTVVLPGMKVGDVDPRGNREYCFTISEKARAIAGGVLAAILQVFNKPECFPEEKDGKKA